MEFTLLWAALTAVTATWAGLRIWDDRLPARAVDHLLAATLGGLVVGRLTAMIAQGVNPLTNPAEIIIVRGGVATPAAAATFVAVLVWSTRTLPGAVDAIAPAVLFGLAGWHAGCLWRGACLGTPSDLPWAWALPGSAVTRHPVELFAALGLAVAAWLVASLPWRPWLRSGVALVMASGLRLVTDLVRPSLGDAVEWWYFVGVFVGLGAIAIGPLLPPPRQGEPT